MPDNPMDACPPDRFVDCFTIRARCDINNVWYVYCKEWEFSIRTRSLTQSIALLVGDIEEHNKAREQQQQKKGDV